MRVSTYLHTREATSAKLLLTKWGSSIAELIPWHDYIEHATFDPAVQAVHHGDLMAFSRDLHEFMRADVKAGESEKPLFVSGTLIALRNKIFSKTFVEYTPEGLAREWLRTIQKELGSAEMPNSKLQTIILPYSNIAAHPEMPKNNKKHPKALSKI